MKFNFLKVNRKNKKNCKKLNKINQIYHLKDFNKSVKFFNKLLMTQVHKILKFKLKVIYLSYKMNN